MKIDGTWVGAAIVILVGGVILFNGQGRSTRPPDDNRVETRPDRVKSCHALRGPVEGRVASCFAELGSARPSQKAQDAIRSSQKDLGALMVVGPKLEMEGEQQELAGNKDLLALIMANDEGAFASGLKDAEVRSLVVYRDMTGAIDRDSRVLSRLARHDFLEWFQLRYVTEELLVYTVRASPSRLPLKTGDKLLKGLRARLAGTAIPKQTWNPAKVRLMGVVRGQGLTLAIRHVVASGNKNQSRSVLELALDEMAVKIEKRWRREVAVYGHGRLEDTLDDLRFEIHVVMERAPIEPRSRFAIFDLWEMGVDGMMFRHRAGVKEEKFTYMPGSELFTHSWRSADKFLREAVKTGGWHDRRPWEDTATRLDIIRTQHFMEERLGGGDAVRLVRGQPEVSMEDMSADNMRQMLIDGGEWWVRNMKDDGHINYKFWPTQNRMSEDYNEVRHILSSRDLMDVRRYRADDRYAVAAEHAMDWLMKYAVWSTDKPHASLLHPPDGSMLFRYRNNQKLGTVAVALLGWVEYAKGSGDHSHDREIRAMAKFTLSQSLANGKFDPYYVPRSHSYYGNVNDIVPGEAALALGEVADYFGETEEWMGFFERYMDFYEPWFKERALRKQQYGRWPENHYTNSDRLELVQFGPWSVMAARKYYELTGDKRAGDFGLSVADWMIDEYQWREDRTPWPDYVGGYYKMTTELPAMQTFCYSEGTAAAYRLAAQHRPEEKDKYDKSTHEAIRFLRTMMYDDVNAYFVAETDLVHGGIKYTMNENKIRIDYVGHGLSTISQYLDAREADPAVELVLSPIDLSGPANPNRQRPVGDEGGALGAKERECAADPGSWMCKGLQKY